MPPSACCCEIWLAKRSADSISWFSGWLGEACRAPVDDDPELWVRPDPSGAAAAATAAACCPGGKDCGILGASSCARAPA